MTKEPSIREQFPICAKVRGLNGGWVSSNTLKITLLAAIVHEGVPQYESAHRVHVNTSQAKMGRLDIGGTPQKDNRCIYTGRFAHYSMTHEAQELAKRKRADREQSDTYVRLTSMAMPCNFSLPPRSVRSARGWQRQVDLGSWDCLKLKPDIHSMINASRMPCQDTGDRLKRT